MEDNKDFLTEETEGTTDNDTMYADTEETLEKAASLNDDSFSGDYSFSEFDSDAEAAEESEAAALLQHKVKQGGAVDPQQRSAGFPGIHTMCLHSRLLLFWVDDPIRIRTAP